MSKLSLLFISIITFTPYLFCNELDDILQSCNTMTLEEFEKQISDFASKGGNLDYPAGNFDDPEQKYSEPSALHMMLDYQAYDHAKILLQYGANPNIEDRFHKTPILKAIHRLDEQAISLLLEYEAELDIYDESGSSLLVYAAATSPQILGILLNTKKINLYSGLDGFTPLHTISAGLSAAYSMLNEDPNDLEPNDLETITNLEQAITILIKHGANPYVLNCYGDTPLQLFNYATSIIKKLASPIENAQYDEKIKNFHKLLQNFGK